MDPEMRFWLLNGLRYGAYLVVFAAAGAVIGRICRPRSGIAFTATCVATALLYLALLAVVDPHAISDASTSYDFLSLVGGWVLLGLPAIPIALFVSSHVPRPPKI
jgi:hypothetical protein